MGIHFVCHHCSYALHVKDFQAGKRGKCPSCNGTFRIPIGDASYSSAIEDALDSSAVSKVKQAFQEINSVKASNLASDSSGSIAIALEPNSKKGDKSSPPPDKVNADDLPAALQAASDAKWFVRPPSGGQFGPAPAGLLISWVAESRVTPDSLLCQQGSNQWQMANELLPELFATNTVLRALPEAKNVLELGAQQSSGVDPAVIRSGAVLRKKMQKRRKQLTMVVLLATVSFVLLSILIYVLVFQVEKPTVVN